MINFKQFKDYVVVPTLRHLENEIHYSDEAVDLLMMTAAHESKGGKYLRQVGVPDGVGAYGVYQMELGTSADIWANFLDYRSLGVVIDGLVSSLKGESLITNLSYATAMARTHYYRVPQAIPTKSDSGYLDKLGRYAKKYYNTPLGKATASKYVTDYLEWRDS